MLRRAALASIVFVPFALAASLPARAAEHKYYVSAEDETQAVIIDAASKTQSGATLRFDVSLLRKSPIHLSAGDIYWADGVIEIECLEHRTRFALVSGLTLDRNRRFNEPNPAFRTWSDNPSGSQARAREEFLCRGHADNTLKPIADMADFAAAFVDGAAQANGSPPPAPAAPPAKTPAAQAQLAPYYVQSRNEQFADLLDIAHAKRVGPIAVTKEITLMAVPEKMGGADFYWAENIEEFDCAQHRYRQDTNATFWTLDRRTNIGASDDVKFGDWIEDKPTTKGLAIEELICLGTVHSGLQAAYDLVAFQRQYFASLKRK